MPAANIAWFVTPHGFGHAARAIAIMMELEERCPQLTHHVFTLAPEWFFAESLDRFVYHAYETDLGLVQHTPLQGDLNGTVERLDELLPFSPDAVRKLGAEVRQHSCDLVVCDIAALGILVADAAGVPSILVENFTWDWIYEEYVAEHPSMAPHIEYLRGIYEAPSYRIQTEPVCCPRPDTDCTTRPVSRPPSRPAREIRRQLNARDRRVVLIATGGWQDEYPFLPHLSKHAACLFVATRGKAPETAIENLRLLSSASDFYFPDLVHAADLVVGKSGYSTLAEVYQAGVPFAFMLRDDFRETRGVLPFIERTLHGQRITGEEFYSGAWLDDLDKLLSLPRQPRSGPRGAEQAADFLAGLFRHRSPA